MTKLSEVLSQLIADSEAYPGTPQRTHLTGGLGIDVLVRPQPDSTTTTHLQLSRSSTEPSDNEYKTVIEHWPYPLARPTARWFKHNGRTYLAACWPTPARLT
jgi:hypothetical protein